MPTCSSGRIEQDANECNLFPLRSAHANAFEGFAGEPLPQPTMFAGVSQDTFCRFTQLEQLHQVSDRSIRFADMSRELFDGPDAALAPEGVILFGQFEGGW